MATTTRLPRRRQSRPGLEGLEGRLLLTTAGSIDQAFAAGQGYSLLPPSSLSGASTSGAAEAVQADGKVVVAGLAMGISELLVARFDADGTLDSSFGTSGRALVAMSGQVTTVQAIAIQPDGKIVVGGTLTKPNPDSILQAEFAATRLDADGTLDTSFGTGGTASLAVGSPPRFDTRPEPGPHRQAIAASRWEAPPGSTPRPWGRRSPRC
jgi:uncharacterized delta-60 repeat protein